MKQVTSGGGWPAIRYVWRAARRSGGVVRTVRAMMSRNACKTCALGMGGQRGGMVDETGRFPEVCKKSVQAMAADMQEPIQDDFFERHTLHALARWTPRELEHAGRLVRPVIADATDTRFRPIGWGDALARIIDRFKDADPDETFFYVSGRSSNEAGFLVQLLARMYGTNNVNNCSYYCHQASGVGLSGSLGTGTATIVREDLDRCDVLFLIGGNPASNHPRLMRAMMQLRRRGGHVVVINPMIETGLVSFSVPSDVRSLLFGSPIADMYIQPHTGGDIALLCGIAKRIDELGAVDDAFVAHCTEHGNAVRDHLRDLDWPSIVARSGVDRATIDHAAACYAGAERAIFAWTMGITHHVHGVDNVRAIVNLALLRGMVGRPGAGLLPIRGHSNVQGVGSVGVTPALKQTVFDRLERHFGVTLPTMTGLDTLACVDAMHAGRMRLAWCLGGNLYGASPDSAYVRDAFARVDAVVYLSTTLNTGHIHGRGKETLILPVLARDEEHEPTTQESMFNFVRLSDGGARRHTGPRSEVALVAGIARGVLGDDGPIDWRSMERHGRIRDAIAAVVPGYGRIGAIDETRREFQIDGRTFHRPVFPTPSRKARMHVTQIPALNVPDGQLRLMTIRSEGQFNTVVYEDEDLYRHQDRRDVILMNTADIDRFGLAADQRVVVRSAVGELNGIIVRPYAIRAGNAAMYFPEANVLVPRAVDTESRTPAYKAVMVTVHDHRVSVARRGRGVFGSTPGLVRPAERGR
ncbi:MAG: FdhF/YdeP family oxidoreductase [Phycisphaerae bacterium]